ncbi:hypothetical protein LTR94_032216, partial [Friedmanniomyces endolithicus]
HGHLRRGHRGLPDFQQPSGDQGHPGRPGQVLRRAEVEEAGLQGSAQPAVPADQDDEVQGRDRPGKPHRKAGRKRHLPEIPQGAEGPLRHRLHLRHPADDDHEPRGSAPDRGRHGEAAGEAPPRGPGPGPRAADPGRRPARPGHRRRRAGHHQDHGFDHRAAGSAGRHDRRRPGRHLPG